MPRAFTEAERERVRARLLAAAREAMPRTGLRRTPVEQLTRSAGIAKGSFYLFFESREALLLELLRSAEAEARVALRAAVHRESADRLERVLRVVFRQVLDNPVLRTLTDAEELAWLARAMPVEVLQAAQLDDDAFFGDLYDGLVDRGAIAEGRREVFLGLPRVALGVLQQREALGERLEATIDLLVLGLARELQTPP